ncbi:MAG: glycine cleavage system aminomethyltransferase GcvT [Bacteroidales bacterium]|nr:glycine cleavage system aminomethyltransferase GcvT [Bacteroidales bacterium]
MDKPQQELKFTPFAERHIAMGAKMVPFAGFYMPVEYSGITDEHLTVRQCAGVFDVSHMGEIWVEGKHALDFLQYVTTNDVSKLYDGKVQYSCFPNGKGGIVDDILVYRFSGDRYLLVVNASNIDKDWNWLLQQNSFGVELNNVSDSFAQLAIQGPLAVNVLQPLTGVKLDDLKYYTFVQDVFAGVRDVIISATGYTGAGGFEIYFDKKYAEVIWDAIFESGHPIGMKPAGLGARDTLRLEMGYCLYGNDIDDTTSPIEANLGWIVKFESYKNFIDKDLLLEQKNKGVNRRRVGFRMIDKGIPRHGYNIKNMNGETIGIVTSGTLSPVLKEGIGMGYVSAGYEILGQEIYIEIRGKMLKAQITDMPFVSSGVLK